MSTDPEYMTRWLEAHPDYHRKWAAAHKEERAAYQHEYQKGYSLKRSMIQQERYHTDPEYRAKKIESAKRWQAKQKYRNSKGFVFGIMLTEDGWEDLRK